jgi:hypothetical protein
LYLEKQLRPGGGNGTPPLAFRAALDELQQARQAAGVLGEMLLYFGRLLQGQRPDPEGPPIDDCPTRAEVIGAIKRRAQAFDRVLYEWERLSPGLQEFWQKPDPDEQFE